MGAKGSTQSSKKAEETKILLKFGNEGSMSIQSEKLGLYSKGLIDRVASRKLESFQKRKTKKTQEKSEEHQNQEKQQQDEEEEDEDEVEEQQQQQQQQQQQKEPSEPREQQKEEEKVKHPKDRKKTREVLTVEVKKFPPKVIEILPIVEAHYNKGESLCIPKGMSKSDFNKALSFLGIPCLNEDEAIFEFQKLLRNKIKKSILSKCEAIVDKIIEPRAQEAASKSNASFIVPTEEIQNSIDISGDYFLENYGSTLKNHLEDIGFKVKMCSSSGISIEILNPEEDLCSDEEEDDAMESEDEGEDSSEDSDEDNLDLEPCSKKSRIC